VPEVVIRRLAPKDVSAYRRVRLEALKGEPENYGSTFEEESIKPKLISEDPIVQQSPIHVVFGAFHENDLVGIMAYFREERHKLRHRGKVTQVYVSPDYRGQGIAKRLLKDLVDYAFAQPEIEVLTLEVVDSNKAAVRVYESVGFKCFGLMERYFKTERGYTAQQFMKLEKV
jgi:ribosomal protein S18 acetylase RimI-like enzyme